MKGMMNTNREYWITVRNHPNYEVSNLGRVRHKITRKILSQSFNYRGGYLRVFMDGKKHYVHRVVLSSFSDVSGEGLDVNHIDGDKENNCLWNLEWTTRKENIRHSVDTGLKNRNKVTVVRCKQCRLRDYCNFSRDDDFYCADGKK